MRRHSWHVVYTPDPEFALGASIRGSELSRLLDKHLISRMSDGRVVVTRAGRTLGRRLILLFDLLEQSSELYRRAMRADDDIKALVNKFDDDLWRLLLRI